MTHKYFQNYFRIFLITRLCLGVMEKYVELAPNESAARIVQSWRPVLSRILKGLTRLSDQHFLEFYEPFYDHIVDVAAAETSPELRQECKVCLKRIGKVHGLVTNDAIVTE